MTHANFAASATYVLNKQRGAILTSLVIIALATPASALDINSFRAEHHLPRLTVSAACAHANTMASHGPFERPLGANFSREPPFLLREPSYMRQFAAETCR
jgi:hypothetical protein